MYSFKEKKLHYNRLQNQYAASADLKLLRSINPDAPVLPAWERSPERFANKILYLLLDYATAEQIRKNRRNPVSSVKEKLEETVHELQEKSAELKETKDTVQELQEKSAELKETKDTVQELQERVEESEFRAEKAETSLDFEKKKEV